MAESGTSIETPVVVKVTTAGTAVQLPETVGNDTTKTVVVQALSTNEEAVVIGDENVVAAAGTKAAPTQRGIELVAKQVISLDLVSISTLWVDSRKNGDGVAILSLNA